MTVVSPDVETEPTFKELLDEYEENNDPLHRTHVINPPSNPHIFKPGMTAQDIVDYARKHQIEIVALCGYKFVPKHNPDKYEQCDPCFNVAAGIMREDG